MGVRIETAHEVSGRGSYCQQTSIPLTLEILRLPQLCQMKGERVQVARMGTMWQSEGATVFDNGDCRSDSGGLCYHELYGSTWIAFRLPPEEV